MASPIAISKPMFVARNSVPRHSAVRLKTETDAKRGVRNESNEVAIASHFTAPRKWAIKLADISHNRKDRIARDQFLNQAMEEADVPLLRFQTRPSYTTDQIAQKLAPLKQRDAA